MPRASRTFASDNAAGIHPEVLQAIIAANQGHALAYGEDAYTAAAVAKFREHLGEDVDVFLVFGGTAANVLGLQAMTRPSHAILCTDCAHIQVDECGAPERFTGAKLLPVPAPDGKLTPAALERAWYESDDPHAVQPKVVSVTQSTERGTVYTPDELRAISAWARAHGLRLHMDGARIANAAASLDVPLRAITRDAGVDVLSFGGTKNGILGGEAVIFFDRALARDFDYIRMQGLQLASKMRFVAAQFIALLSDDLWRRNAEHANRMAQRLAAGVAAVPRVRVTQRVEANAVFAVVPPECVAPLQQRYAFSVWTPALSEVRWMTAFDTAEEDVDDFVTAIRQIVA